MRVITRWPALVPAIERAGHEPVLVEEESVGDEKWEKVYINGTFTPGPVSGPAPGSRECDLPEPPVTARPRGAQRYPR